MRCASPRSTTGITPGSSRARKRLAGPVGRRRLSEPGPELPFAMPPLPFQLKVPARDNLAGESVVSWTSFDFHGLMWFDGALLHLEWSGTAATDAVEGVSVRSDVMALPTESVSIPLERLRAARLAGGWWRPRLELSGNDMRALAEVPSEAAGTVRFWIRRRDRHLAGTLVSAMRQAAREHLPLPGAEPFLSPARTPPEGV